MGGHAVGFVHRQSVKQIMVKLMIVIIFFRPGVEANSRDRCLATQAFHMNRGLMISNASSLVNLKIALGALEMAIERMPSFPGQLGDNIDFGDPGFPRDNGPNIMQSMSIGQVNQHVDEPA